MNIINGKRIQKGKSIMKEAMRCITHSKKILNTTSGTLELEIGERERWERRKMVSNNNNGILSFGRVGNGEKEREYYLVFGFVSQTKERLERERKKFPSD